MSSTASTSVNPGRDSKDSQSWSKDGLSQSTDRVGDNLENAAAQAGQKVREIADTASEELAYAGKKIGQSSEAVMTQIRAHPVQSSLMALAAGFVLGKVFRL